MMQGAPPIPPLPRARWLAHQDTLQAALDEVFAGDQFILGPQTAAFESEWARFLGAKHGVGVASGTDALELALRACGIGTGHAVLTVSWTATATVAAIERAGATPVLVDIEADSFTMDPGDLEQTLVEFRHQPGQPELRAVIPVHLYGHSAAMPALSAIAREYGLRLIEDCAQAHGAGIEGRMVGTWGDLAAFSFYPTKNLGAFGDAGAVVTNDDKLAGEVRRLREYGWTPRPISSVPGINSRLDEVQAALLRVLLPHLPAENLRREQLAQRYKLALRSTGVTMPSAQAWARHVYHQYVVRTGQREALQSYLGARGIATQIHYPVPVHQQPAYAGRLPCSRRGLPRTLAVAREVLSLPMSPHWTDAQVDPVVEALARWQEPPRPPT